MDLYRKLTTKIDRHILPRQEIIATLLVIIKKKFLGRVDLTDTYSGGSHLVGLTNYCA